MCAIAGELRFDGRAVDAENLFRMRDTMIHRGPDGEGHYISPDQELGLGHRRLSIIDLSSAAAQPMVSIDKKVIITFNGEIYNHMDLRKELRSLGREQWSTDHSDTEVVLQAYQQWGVDCLSRLRGMFAFAIWDENKRQLFIARDRIGIKPLYYYFDHQRFLFGSEIKAILAAPDVPRRVNEQSFYRFLTFATTPAPETLFANIFKLPAAHFALVTSKGMSEPRRYWDVWDNPESLEGVSKAQIGKRLVQELETAVSLHKASDVPVGLFLSGGVDSTINAVLFSRNEKKTINTFTIDYASKLAVHKSEAQYAHKVATMVGAFSHERRLTQEDLIDFLPQMIHLQDEPFADPVCVPLFYVSKMARDAGVKVCQVGEGADELFCGYENWIKHYHIDLWRQRLKPQFLREFVLFSLRLLNKEKTFTYEATRRAFQGELQFWAGAEAFSQSSLRQILSRRMRDQFENYSVLEVIEPIRKRFLEKAHDKGIVQWMGYMDLNLRLPETLLMRTDKMGMGASIETRVPFLDHKIVEFAMRIPTQHKLRGGEPKHILKRAFRDVVPAEIIKRKKQGFSTPLEDWFLSDLGTIMRNEVKAFCLETDLLDWTAVSQLFEERKALQCWFLLNVALWWKSWVKS